ELDTVFAAIARSRAEALFILSDSMLFRERDHLADLALRTRLPTMYHWRPYVDAGGLMSYGPNLSDLFGQAAVYVDRILKGARPADLPVEQPTRFEFVVNLKTAKSLGLTIPQALLARASDVIR